MRREVENRRWDQGAGDRMDLHHFLQVASHLHVQQTFTSRFAGSLNCFGVEIPPLLCVCVCV